MAGAFNPVVGYSGTVQLSSTPSLSYDAHDVFLSYGQSLVDLATPPGTGQNQQNVINAVNSTIYLEPRFRQASKTSARCPFRRTSTH